MNDDRISSMQDKLEVFRAVIRRYDEIDGGKPAKDVVEEEISLFLAKKKG